MEKSFIFFRKEVLVTFTAILLVVVCFPYKVNSQSSIFFNAISITMADGKTKDIKWENFSRLVRRSPEFFTFFFKESNDSIQNVISFRSNKIDFTNVGQSEFNDINFTVYPNPSVGEVNISAFLETKTNVDLDVYSVTGQIIKKVHLTNQFGHFDYSFDISYVPSGTYICSMINGNFNLTKKILKK